MKIQQLLVIAGALVLGLGNTAAQEVPATSLNPDEVVAAARRWVLKTRGTYDGIIRQGDTVLPFVAEFDTRKVTYRFPTIRREIEILPTSHEVEGGNLKERIGDTSLTVEDLTLWYLAWLEARIVGTRSGKWVVVSKNPTAHGDYGSAQMQIHTKSGAMTGAEIYDREGRLIRTLDIKKFATVDTANTYMPTRIKVKAFDPSGAKDTIWIEILQRLK